MNIYMLVCRLFWEGMDIREIADTFPQELKEYQHTTHRCDIMFSNPLTAALTIIECEQKAHEMADSFEPDPDFKFDHTL